MRIPKLKRSRAIVLLAAGTLALVIASSGIVAALAGRPSPATAKQSPSGSVGPNATRTSTSVSTTSTATSTAAGPVLAEGTYPTYIRQVDVNGATITVDVIQVFKDEAAAKAAIADGKSSREAQYLYVYVRNQSSRLRTLTVARDVRIQFADGCEAPPNQHEALTELAKRTTTFNTAYYYDVTVSDGTIHGIVQHLTMAAC